MKLHNTMPVVFTACPMITNIRNSGVVFGVMFFVAVISLIIRKAAVSFITHVLGLSGPLRGAKGSFKIRLPRRVSSSLDSVAVAARVLRRTSALGSVGLPGKALIVVIGHKSRFLVPGKALGLRMKSGLLLVSRGSGRRIGRSRWNKKQGVFGRPPLVGHGAWLWGSICVGRMLVLHDFGLGIRGQVRRRRRFVSCVRRDVVGG